MARRTCATRSRSSSKTVAAGRLVVHAATRPGTDRGAVAELTDFLTGPGDLDPLLRMAVAHYQFEAIHPFVDGNGRTGRILNILALVQAGLLEIPVLTSAGTSSATSRNTTAGWLA